MPILIDAMLTDCCVVDAMCKVYLSSDCFSIFEYIE